MSVQWVIPHQARYGQTSNTFLGTFNVPVLGQYSFAVAANTMVRCLPLDPNTHYLVERVTVGADVSETDYAAALDLSSAVSMPRLSILRERDRQMVYNTSIPLLRFVEQQESAVWVSCDGSGDWLCLTMTGALNQTPALVGIATITISVSFSVYAIESTIYNRAFRGAQSLSLGARVRGS